MDIKDVENLVKLARLDLTKQEKEKILSDMGNILEYVKQIEEVVVPTDKVIGILTPSGVGNYNVWREDEIKKAEFSRDLILGQFPDSQDGFLKVKKIL